MVTDTMATPNYLVPTQGRQRLSGLFTSQIEAERAVDRLEALGIPRTDISLFFREEEKLVTTDATGETKAAEGAGVGSAVGGTIGAIFGAIVAAVTAITIPGAGIVIAGPLAGALAGAGAGGLTGGLIGAFVGAGVPEETARVYESAIHAGGVVVVVDVPETLVPEAREILRFAGS
ncbi:MAG: hypothetical protein SFU56_18770 [Capsulimonadales bacterium]|nr:hypothetical protein [Capsulimonadales bacterium]